MVDVRTYAEELARRLESEANLEEDQTYSIAMGDPDSGDDDAENLLCLYGDSLEDGSLAVVVLRVYAGDLDDIEEPEQLESLLGLAADCWFSRLYVEGEEGDLVAEAALPLTGLAESTLEVAAREVVDLARASLDLLGDVEDDEDSDEQDEDDEESDGD